MLNFFRSLFVGLAVVSIASFGTFDSTVSAFEEDNGEQTSESPEDNSCEAEVKRESEAKGVELAEKDFEKAVKKCETKRKREKNKVKCQPTGSRLNRC